MGNEADGVSEQDRNGLPLDPLVKHSTISLETMLLVISVYSNDLIAPSLLKLEGIFRLQPLQLS